MRKKGYYVYTLAYPTGEVFYVGKGIRGRINLHEAEARKGVNSHKCNIIRKIWREGGEVIKTKVCEGLSEEEAFEYERMLIAAYGRKNLVNLTDGGEGASGHIPSDETRAKYTTRLMHANHFLVKNLRNTPVSLMVSLS
jgi:hypothetical protein